MLNGHMLPCRAWGPVRRGPRSGPCRRKRAQRDDRRKRRRSGRGDPRSSLRAPLSKPDSGRPAATSGGRRLVLRKTRALGPTETSYADIRITADPATSTGTGPSRRLTIADVRYLKPGDQVYVRREIVGAVWEWAVPFLIRLFTFTKKDKRPTVVNHVATVLRPVLLIDGDPTSVYDWEIAEALGSGGFQVRLLIECYGDARRYSLAIARRIDARQEHREKIVAACEHLLGKTYGFVKIAAHTLDYFLTLAWNAVGGRGDVSAVRQLCRSDRYPMCSWASLYVYEKAGLPFDVSTASGSPDDMWDESRAKSCAVWVWPYCAPSLKSDLYGPGFGDYDRLKGRV